MEAIDRITPTRRPDQRAVMRQSWRHLTFLHWEVPPESLAAHLPAGLTVDTFEGRAFVGLVPFTMRNVRPVGFPSLPWLSYFHETNVRTYVHYRGRDPGVWFFSLDAANPLAVMVARRAFGLNYRLARMRLDTVDRSGEASFVYHSSRPGTRLPEAFCHVDSTPIPSIKHATAGTLEHFLVERYLLYTVMNGNLYSGRVHHDPYPLQAGRCNHFDETLLADSGLIRPDTPPLTHHVTGVDVAVFGLKRVH